MGPSRPKLCGRLALVLCAVAALESASKQGDSYRASHPVDAPGCFDDDNGTTDRRQSVCTAYIDQRDCGEYDTVDFHAMSMCCACGGGKVLSPSIRSLSATKSLPAKEQTAQGRAIEAELAGQASESQEKMFARTTTTATTTTTTTTTTTSTTLSMTSPSSSTSSATTTTTSTSSDPNRKAVDQKVRNVIVSKGEHETIAMPVNMKRSEIMRAENGKAHEASNATSTPSVESSTRVEPASDEKANATEAASISRPSVTKANATEKSSTSRPSGTVTRNDAATGKSSSSTTSSGNTTGSSSTAKFAITTSIRPQDCEDTDEGAVDKDLDGCSEYIDSSSCGHFDTERFSALTMCCVCGGGKSKISMESEALSSTATTPMMSTSKSSVSSTTNISERSHLRGSSTSSVANSSMHTQGSTTSQQDLVNTTTMAPTESRATTTLQTTTTVTSTSEATTSTTLTTSSEHERANHEPLILPAKWSRLERDEEWDTSPFVSQSRLDRLWTKLFHGYSKYVPPVPHDGGPLAVGVGVNFVKFKDMDEVAGTIDIAMNLRLCWADDRLAFDAQRFFNMSWSHEGDKIPLRSGLIWTPDVLVLNAVEGMQQVFHRDSSTLVLSDNEFKNETGVNVLWSRPMDVKSECKIDMSQYPFDVQKCQIVIGSWASSRRQMLLVPQQYFQQDTVRTSEFNVLHISVFTRDVYTRGSAQMFNEVVYELVLDRFPHFYMINFVIPMLALTFLTVATMWIDSRNIGPRVNSSTKLLLCIVSIIFVTARRRPPIAGDIWLDRFQSHCMAISMLSVLQHLVIDYLSKVIKTMFVVTRVDQVDTASRAAIFWMGFIVIFQDLNQVRNLNVLHLFLLCHSNSTRLLVIFLYVIFALLALTSVLDCVRSYMPWTLRHYLQPKSEKEEPPIASVRSTRTSSEVASTLAPPLAAQAMPDDAAGLASLKNRGSFAAQE